MPAGGSKGKAEATSGCRPRGLVSSHLRAIWTRAAPRGDNHTELWWDKLRSKRSLAAVMEEGSDVVSPRDQMWQIESRTWRRRRRRRWLVSHHDRVHWIGRRAQTMARWEGPTHRDDYSNTPTWCNALPLIVLACGSQRTACLRLHVGKMCADEHWWQSNFLPIGSYKQNRRWQHAAKWRTRITAAERMPKISSQDSTLLQKKKDY